MIDEKVMEKLVILATAIGLIKIAATLRHIHKEKDVRSYNVNSTSLGITTSIIWLLYDLSKGLKMGAATAAAALCLDLYILHLLIQERRRNDKRG